MIAKTIFYVAAVSFVTGCASTVAATTEKEHVEQEVVYRPVEEVWPDVVPQKPRSNPKTPAKNSKAGKNLASKTPTYAQRRVVQVTGSAPVSGGVQDNIVEGPVQGVHNVVSKYGENHVVRIARHYPNTILTPFQQPEVKGGVGSHAADVVGSTVFIEPLTAKRFWIAIYDKANPRSLPVSLTLSPQANLMSQTLTLATGGLSPAEKSGVKTGKAAGFSQLLADVLKELVGGRVPSGYTVQPLRQKINMANGMSAEPIQRYSGAQFDVYRYRLRNTTGQPQVLAEEMFGANDRVVAVSFFPKISVYPGESTDVLIMVGKGGTR